MIKLERDRIAQGFEICTYIITKKCTMRKAAEKFKLSPPTARCRVELVKEHDIDLYKKTKRIQLETALKVQSDASRKDTISSYKEKKNNEAQAIKTQEENEEDCGINRRIATLRRNIHTGDTVTVFKKDKDEESESNKKLKSVEVKARVLGVYSHTILVNINGIRESFTYDEINRLIKD